MSFRKFGPGGEFDELSRRILNMMDQMVQRRYVEFRDYSAWQPAANVYETTDAYVVCVELAGVDRERLDIRVDEQRRLIICGRREKPQCEHLTAEGRIHALEIADGSFARQIDLPYDIDVNAIAASYDRGMLWIRIPKAGRRPQEGQHV